MAQCRWPFRKGSLQGCRCHWFHCSQVDSAAVFQEQARRGCQPPHGEGSCIGWTCSHQWSAMECSTWKIRNLIPKAISELHLRPDNTAAPVSDMRIWEARRERWTTPWKMKLQMSITKHLEYLRMEVVKC